MSSTTPPLGPMRVPFLTMYPSPESSSTTARGSRVSPSRRSPWAAGRGRVDRPGRRARPRPPAARSPPAAGLQHAARRTGGRAPGPPSPRSQASCSLPRVRLVARLLLLLAQPRPLGLVEEAEGRRRARRVEQLPIAVHARLGEVNVADVDDAVEALDAVEEGHHVVEGATHLHLHGHV